MSLEPIFNIFYLISKVFFHPTSQNFRFYRYQDTAPPYRYQAQSPLSFQHCFQPQYIQNPNRTWNMPWPRSMGLPAACHNHLLPKGLGRVSRHITKLEEDQSNYNTDFCQVRQCQLPSEPAPAQRPVMRLPMLLEMSSFMYDINPFCSY